MWNFSFMHNRHMPEEGLKELALVRIFQLVVQLCHYHYHYYHYKSQYSQVIILPLYIRSKIVRHCCFAAVFIVIFAQLLLLSACNIEPLAHPGSLRLSQALYCSPDLLTGSLLQDFLRVGYHLNLISQLSNFSACFNHIFQMSLIGAKKRLSSVTS